MPEKTKYSSVILSTAYFPPLEYFYYLNKFETSFIENFENYQKQTYRNRCIIYGPNAPLSLVIPVIRPDKPKTIIKDVIISYHDYWQKSHWKSIRAAYNSSPFFLYYQDDILKGFNRNYKYLLDFNNELLFILRKLIGIESDIFQTLKYKEEPDHVDMRNDIKPKNKKNNNTVNLNFPPYIQVFDNKHGFIPNLSILDLLFNEGPNALEYISKLTFKNSK